MQMKAKDDAIRGVGSYANRIGERQCRARPVVLLLLFLAILSGAIWHGKTPPAMAQTTGDDAEEIVFIDQGGFIRVHDFTYNGQQTGASFGNEIRWFSPVGGFRDVALGDVNDDDGLEIIGVRGGMDDGQLVIYDPVVDAASTNIPIEGYINGIPWAILYTQSVLGEPTLVGAGNLVLEAPGAEILYGSRIDDETAVDPEANYQLSALAGASNPPDGRSWRTIVDQLEFEEEWTWLDIGNLDNAGTDEIALVAYEEGWLYVYQDLLRDPILERENNSRPWRAALFGNFMDRFRPGLLAIRNAGPGIANFWVFEYPDGRWVDSYAEAFFPPPEFLFTADAEGSGGVEAFMLRSLPIEITNRPRLFSRDELGRSIIEDFLNNTDNAFRAGAGGNVDGDFGDEVVIIRNNRIRIYTEPNNSATFEEIQVSTNSRTVRIGNLDGGAFDPQPVLTVNNAASITVEDTLSQGIVQDDPDLGSEVLISASLPGQDELIEGVPFSYSIEPTPGLPLDWVTAVPTPTRPELETTSTLRILFDTRGLAPGVYETVIRVRSPAADPTNQPLRVFIRLNVLPGIDVSPNPGVFLFDPCEEPLIPQQRIFTIVGAFGLPYAVQVGNGGQPVDWATVAPAGGTIPNTFTVTVDPAPLASANPVSAALIIDPLDGSGAYVRQTVPIYLLCVEGRALLPVIAQQ